MIRRRRRRLVTMHRSAATHQPANQPVPFSHLITNNTRGSSWVAPQWTIDLLRLLPSVSISIRRQYLLGSYHTIIHPPPPPPFSDGGVRWGAPCDELFQLFMFLCHSPCLSIHFISAPRLPRSIVLLWRGWRRRKGLHYYYYFVIPSTCTTDSPATSPPVTAVALCPWCIYLNTCCTRNLIIRVLWFTANPGLEGKMGNELR